MKNQEKRLIFYDFEVFEEDFLVVFIEYATRKRMVIVNDREKLIKFYQKAKDFIFVGFNSRNYDSTIFKEDYRVYGVDKIFSGFGTDFYVFDSGSDFLIKGFF